jgi:Tfp pilus assembly protein FimT
VRPHRSALTLVEVILVLTLMVIIAAVSAPLLTGSITEARLRNGGDLLRAALGRARLTAMQAGETYVFRCEPKGKRYQIVQLSAIDAATTESSTKEDEYSEHDTLRLSRAELPDGVTFDSCQIAAAPQLAAPAAATASGGWSDPILFYSDGTTSDAVLNLTNTEHHMIRVTLRGLTGITRSTPVENEARP